MDFYHLVDQFREVSNTKSDIRDEIEDRELERLAKVEIPNRLMRLYLRLCDFLTIIHFQYSAERRLELEQKYGRRLERWQIHGYSIRFYLPFNKRSGCSIQAYLIYLFVIYQSIKIIWICSIHISLATRMEAWQHGEQVNHAFEVKSNRKGNYSVYSRCFLVDELSPQNKLKLNKLNEDVLLLHTIGSPVQTVNELLPFSNLSILALVWIVAFFSALHGDDPDFRFDSLTFLFEPKIERERIRSKANDFKESIYTVLDEPETSLERTQSVVSNVRQSEKQQPEFDGGHPFKAPVESNLERKKRYRELYAKFKLIFESNGQLSFSKYYASLRSKDKERCLNLLTSDHDHTHPCDARNHAIKCPVGLDDHANVLPFPDEKQFFRLTAWFERTIFNKRPQNPSNQFQNFSNNNTEKHNNYDDDDDDRNKYGHLQQHLRSRDRNPIWRLFRGSAIGLKVNPEHLTIRGYRRMCNIHYRVLFVEVIIALLVGLVIAFGFLCREIYNRVEQKNEEFYCATSWRSDALSRRWPIRLLPRQRYSQSYNYKINDYDESYENSSSVTTSWEELKLLLNPRAVTYLFEILIGYTMISFQFGFYVIALMTNSHIQSTWMGQIQEQLNLIGRMMDSYSSQQLVMTDKWWSDHDESTLSGFRDDIERSLTQVYLNFMLYRRDLRNHLRFFKFMVYHIIICLVVGFILCYEVLSSDRNHLIVWTVMILIFGLINLISHMSVDFTSKLNKLSVKMNKLMAKSARLSLESSDVIGLWRRQIMSTSDVEETFGISILGIEISHSNLVQFNSYVFGASLYLLKSYIV